MENDPESDPMRKNRENLSHVADLVKPSSNLNQETEKIDATQSQGNGFSRRGFLGQTTAVLASAFAGLWSLANPQKARAANSVKSNVQCLLPAESSKNANIQEGCGGGGGSPPPPPNFSVQTQSLIEGLVADFNSHNAANIVSIMDSATINKTVLLAHLTNAFSSCPNLSMVIDSLVIGVDGETATLDWAMKNVTWEVLVEDDLLNYGSAVPTATDEVTGQTVFVVSGGSLILYMDSTHTIHQVLANHGVAVL